jgi:hypothetical protein
MLAHAGAMGGDDGLRSYCDGISRTYHRPHVGDCQSRLIRYLREVHLELVGVLVVVVVALLTLGWSLRPQSSGYPPVPRDIGLGMGTNPSLASTNAADLTLVRTASNGAELAVNAGFSTFRTWSLVIQDPEGGVRLCPRRG